MLEIINIQKNFVNSESSAAPAVHNLNLTIKEGEFFSLLGPSGCGKTTLLRMIAGLETPTSGEIRLNGQKITALPAQERPFNMVFQKYALFPHLTVFENVAFGLKLRKAAASDIQKSVTESLELVGMNHMAQRLPETLSGGQAQRVAIARALVLKPKILLLDEPLSALDQKLREHMQTELKLLQKKLGLTFIYVTHDQEEALALSDRVAVMNLGNLEQVSTPEELYNCPETLFVASFVGTTNFIEGEYMGADGSWSVFHCQNRLVKGQFQKAPVNLLKGTKLQALVRPERLKILNSLASPEHINAIKGRVTHKIFRGAQLEVTLEILPAQFLKLILNSSDETAQKVKSGEELHMGFSAQDTTLFVKD